MMDFRKELARYDFVTIDPQFTGFINETSRAVEACNATMKLIGKELNHANMQIEEILSFAQDENEKDLQLTEQKKTIATLKEEKQALLQGLITVLDRLEVIYRYAIENDRDGWGEQIRLIWNKTSVDILALGLVRIEGEGDLFDARIQVAAHLKEDPGDRKGLVHEVLRCGYMYLSQIIRKAQVTVYEND